MLLQGFSVSLSHKQPLVPLPPNLYVASRYGIHQTIVSNPDRAQDHLMATPGKDIHISTFAGKLASLIGIDDLRLAMFANCFTKDCRTPWRLSQICYPDMIAVCYR